MIFRLPEQPQTISDIVRTGFWIWKATIKQAMPFALALAILNLVFQMLMQWLGAGEALNYLSSSSSLMEVNAPELTMPSFSVFVCVSAYLAIFMILYTAMIYGIDRSIHFERLQPRIVFQVGLQKALPFLAVTILSGLIMLVGFFLFIIPGVMASVYLLFAPYILVTSDKGVVDSLRESYRLVSGSWWFTSTAFSVAILIFIVIALLGNFAEYEQNYLVWITDGIVILLMYPMGISFMLALLYDLQNRKKSSDKYQSIKI